ncbi:MAG: BatA domain-containing protein [Bacteroidota bacterium]
MRFVHPQFLFALFALAVPILVHLFNFRRFKRVLFTNVRFLQEIKQDTRHRSRLKHLLVLASRLLALTFLVLAFAQPYLPARKGASRSARNRVSIWVDNSFSMEAQGTYGPLLEVARERARELVLSYPASDRFQLLTNDFEARDQRFVTREEFLQRLDELRPSSTVRTLQEIVMRQKDAFGAEPSAAGEEQAAFLLSDFQSSLADETPLPPDSSLQTYLLPFSAANTANVSVDTCYFNTPYIEPGKAQELNVRLRNYGEKELKDLPVKLHVNGQQRALAAATVPAGSAVEVKLPFTVAGTGWQEAAVSIADHPVTFDDTFFFAFRVRPEVQVMCIHGGSGSPYLDALFGNDAYFRYRSVSEAQVDYSALQAQQLIVLHGVRNFATGLQQALKSYLEAGGTLVLIPSPDANAAGYSSFASVCSLPTIAAPSNDSTKVNRLETSDPLLSGVFEKGKTLAENLDLPVVRKYLPLSPAAGKGWQPVMRMENGSPFLVRTSLGSGACYTLSVPLDPDYSNFQQHALFVPVFLKAALIGSSEIVPGKITGRYAEFAAGDTLLPGDQVYHVVGAANGFDAIPDVRRIGGTATLTLQDQVKSAGNYAVKAGNSIVNVVAFNYDRKESDLAPMSTEALNSYFGVRGSAPELLDADDPTVGHSLSRLREGISLWKYCIIAVLLFLLAEILLIRYFKPAAR